jgi:hypothetical protein
MYCPQCGQQQVSGEVRFCSRCGFQLEGVSSLMAGGGVMPLTAMQSAEWQETPRRKGARLGGKLILFGIFLIPALGIFHEITKAPEEIMLFGVLCLLAGFLRLIYAMIFEQGPFRQPKTQPQLVYAPAPNQLASPQRGAAELPPAQGTPARAYVPPRTDTAEISYRPSVTENTTRLLAEQEERDKRRARE